MLSFIRNRALLAPLSDEPHAYALYRIDAARHDASLIEEIAIGQSLGAWDERHVEISVLESKVARIVAFETRDGFHWATVAFPWNLWHGQLGWLLAILFGKMSFYEGVQLADVWFQESCFGDGKLVGPSLGMGALRASVGVTQEVPLLMGILKPNVAMSASAIASLYEQTADAGLHIVKDDEIRHDASEKEVLERVSLVADVRACRNLKTLYAVHMQISSGISESYVRALENAGATALLVNVWTSGLGELQRLRTLTRLPILAHPALVGAFGFRESNATIHPRVTLARLLRAAGADLSLFPSPYGKLGLPREIATGVAEACLTKEGWAVNETIPVPSAGIRPEHGPMARADFGLDFVLNAGTGIFAAKDDIRPVVQAFRAGLYGE